MTGMDTWALIRPMMLFNKSTIGLIYIQSSTNMFHAVLLARLETSKRSKPPLQMNDIPPYAFTKLGLDLSGPYPTSLSGNKYIVGLIDLYSRCREDFAFPDKSADNIAHLIIDEIFPRYGSPFEIITDTRVRI